MLFIEPTPKNAGVTLWGDSFTLRELNQLTYDCWESPFLNSESLKDKLFAFSYDIRKAYENCREQTILKDFQDKDFPIYGVKISWILLLVSCSFMRTAMGYYDTSKHDQSLMFLLESSIEETLKKVYIKDSETIIYYYKNLSSHIQDKINRKFVSREIYFLNLDSKVKRKNELGFILQSFNDFPREEYSVFQHELEYPDNLDW